MVLRAAMVIDTVDGRATLGEAVVREALQLLDLRLKTSPQTAFLRGLARDGFVVEEGDHGEPVRLRSALPEEVNLPASDSELYELLRSYQFHTPKGHLDQAIEAHTRGD